MLAAVLIALTIGTLAALGGSFSGHVGREASAATKPAFVPVARNAAARDERYLPMTRKTASLLLYSVLRSGSR